MTRAQYIQKLLAIYKLKYQPSELELKEFELLLQMIPDSDKPTLTLPTSPILDSPNKYPWQRDVVLMYGPPTPTTIDPYFDSTTTLDQFLGSKENNDINGFNKGTEEH